MARCWFLKRLRSMFVLSINVPGKCNCINNMLALAIYSCKNKYSAITVYLKITLYHFEVSETLNRNYLPRMLKFQTFERQECIRPKCVCKLYDIKDLKQISKFYFKGRLCLKELRPYLNLSMYNT